MSWEALRDLAETGELGPAPLTAYAVPVEVEPTEEAEYDALTEAAYAAVGLVVAGSRPARVVVAADAVVQGAADGVVTVSAPVPLERVAALHVDAPGAAADLEAAVAGSDQESILDHELAWYAVQELPELLT